MVLCAMGLPGHLPVVSQNYLIHFVTCCYHFSHLRVTTIKFYLSLLFRLTVCIISCAPLSVVKVPGLPHAVYHYVRYFTCYIPLIRGRGVFPFYRSDVVMRMPIGLFRFSALWRFHGSQSYLSGYHIPSAWRSHCTRRFSLYYYWSSGPIRPIRVEVESGRYQSCGYQDLLSPLTSFKR